LLQGRVALVTGGGRGIGKGIALALADAGAAVSVLARTAHEVEAVAAEIRRRDRRAIACVADVRDPQQIDAAVSRTEAELGPVDLLINNAGNSVLGRLEQQDPEEWWSIVEVNVRGPYSFCRRVLPGMRRGKFGRIINIASVNAKKGALYATAYCTAKHGVLGLTRALALEVASDGITVNAVCPGYVQTDLTARTMAQRVELFGVSLEQILAWAADGGAQKGPLDPSDIASTVVFLASSHAARITGQAINVCGGSVMW
jgi:NAD(P)-dependent dehydrogenase (short-subunit alcohol dehydrogenase family)